MSVSNVKALTFDVFGTAKKPWMVTFSYAGKSDD